MDQTASELVRNVTELVSFPDVALRFNEKLSTDCDIRELAAIIESDPALSAALLRLANSAMYSVGGTVNTVNQSLMLVGLREARDLAFGICAASTFEGVPNDLITVKDFWEHSLHCASAAQFLAAEANIHTADSLFTAGLLHDIGQLVMFSQSPELSRQALEKSLHDNDGLMPHLSEREVFGFDHALVGAELGRAWQFPPSLCDAIHYHHAPFDTEEESIAAIVLHAANSVAVLAELDSRDLQDAPPIDPRAYDRLELDEERIAEAIAGTQESVSELLRLFIH